MAKQIQHVLENWTMMWHLCWKNIVVSLHILQIFISLSCYPPFLTHQDLNRKANIWQMTYLKALSWKKTIVLWFKFHESLFLWVHLTISKHRFGSWYVTEQVSTHWGRVTHICVNKLTIIGSDNGLSPGRRQAIIWTNDGILLIRTFRTHISEIVSEIHTFSFKKMHFKMSSGKWRPSCLGLNVLSDYMNH